MFLEVVTKYYKQNGTANVKNRSSFVAKCTSFISLSYTIKQAIL